jgi:hypothetical protein
VLYVEAQRPIVAVDSDPVVLKSFAFNIFCHHPQKSLCFFSEFGELR